MERKEIFFITKISIISIIILPLLFICTACGNDTKKNNKTGNNEKIKEEVNPLTIDAVYISELGTFIPEDNDSKSENYLKDHPEYNLEHKDSNNNIVMFVFATLKSLSAGENDLKMPPLKLETSFKTNSLETYILYDGNKYSNSLDINNRDGEYTKYLGNYKTAKGFKSDYILYAGENESIKIASYFYVKYHDYKEAIKNNNSFRFVWGSSDKNPSSKFARYENNFDSKDIIIKESLYTINKDLKEKGFIK